MKQYTIGNVTVVVSRPVLTKAERTKRENAILTVLQQFGKSMVEAEERGAASNG